MPEKPLIDLYSRDEIKNYLKEKELDKATPVQARVAPQFRKNNLNVMAPTGSGKTLSFALPLVEALKDLEDQKGAVVQVCAPRAIILTPTRELGRQVHQVFKGIAHQAKCRVRFLAQGEGAKKESQLVKETFDLLVCSPGRLSMMIKKGSFALDQLEYMVLDEADQILDMGFEKDLKSIYQAFPQDREAKVHLFTATHPLDYLERIESVFLGRFFEVMKLDQVHQLSAQVETYNIYLSPNEKVAMLETFIQKEAKGAGIVFINDKNDAKKVLEAIQEKLPKKTFHLLHGEMTPQERRRSHETFSKKGGILLATDIAARGIDLPELYWVLNFDLPHDPVYYIHRSGRVGRLGKVGHVYNFVTSSDVKLIDKINQAIQGQTALKLGRLKAPGAPSKKSTQKSSKKSARKSTRKPGQKSTSKSTPKSTKSSKKRKR